MRLKAVVRNNYIDKVVQGWGYVFYSLPQSIRLISWDIYFCQVWERCILDIDDDVFSELEYYL